MKIVFGIRVLLILLPFMGFGFNLSVTHNNETCPGNASLSFSVSNTDPAGTITYLVYKLPDVTTPYASGPSDRLNGLTPGSYRIIARETVGNTTTTAQQDVTITSSFEPLNYTVRSVNEACSSTSTVTVDINTGIPVTYAIISGPATFPPQTSNTFSGLSAGIYRFRVTDSCGNSLVQAFTVTVNPPLLTTVNPSFTEPTPFSCNFIVANNTIVPAPGTVIAYPLQVEYTLFLPGGPTRIPVVLNSGDPVSQNIAQTIPYDVNNNYIYSIVITDACGITYPPSNFIVNNAILLTADVTPLPCNEYFFTLNVLNFSNSYTLQFIDAPPGFNPTDFNSSYPGPFSISSVVFGSDTNPTPIGDYEVTVTDPCGKTFTLKFTVEDKPPTMNAVGGGFGCMSTEGQITISGSSSKVVTAIITSAPATYPFPLPHDVSGSIDTVGVLNLAPVPQGDYIFRVIDDCGNIFDPVDVTVPEYEDKGIMIDVLQGCGVGNASIRMISNNSKLNSVKIIAAPSGYAFPIPHDASNNILANGELYLADLPAGNYTFETKDDCNFSTTELKFIDGYTITNNAFSLVPNCGVFNIPLDFVSNINSAETFWLQKLLDPATGIWGHPVTEAVYSEGTVPNTANSLQLANNTTNLNYTFNGVFRIVHHFTSFNNGSDIKDGLVVSADKNCLEILSPTLSFNDALNIDDVYRIPCSTTGNFDVLLLANGTPPLHYKIIEKDGSPILIDNGTSNIFTNLVPGIYKFQVDDSCSNSVTRTFDVSDLTALVTIYPTCPLFDCVSTITGNETFDLSAQNPIILGHQSTANYTLSYHISQTDADNNINPITTVTAFNPTNNPETVYIRLIFNQLPNCYKTGSFDLITGQSPKINLLPEYIECGGSTVDLNASVGNLPGTAYSWSNGLTAPSVTISDVGTTLLTVTATNTYGNCNGDPLSCAISDTVTVNIADIPEIERIDTRDWTDNENSITIITTHPGSFEYSIDGINFQDSPVFLNLKPGLYTVYARDAGRCRTVSQEIWLLNYPKFFTPNGDGYNETWYVKNSENEPDFRVYIFDRYGKLITGIISGGPGWDGKLNGKPLFSDDYWFTAYRQDGRIHRGHFTLKR